MMSASLRPNGFCRIPRFVFLLLTMLLLDVSVAHACSCLSPPPAPERAAKSTATFLAKVQSTELTERSRVYRLKVLESFAGSALGEVEVSTPTNGAACGVRFNVGEAYLIFCYGDPDQLRTNLCSANRPADSERGRADLAALRARSPAGKE